jgi:hypothetical protein
MNARLSLTDVVARLQLGLPAGTLVSDAYAVGYLREFWTRYPAVWVLAQRSRAIAEDDGYAGQFRQNFDVEFVVRVVVQRHKDGTTNAGAALNALVDSVTAQVEFWTPPGCNEDCIVISTQDGPPHESVVVYTDIVFRTSISNQRTPT